jgi:hypothetical protein
LATLLEPDGAVHALPEVEEQGKLLIAGGHLRGEALDLAGLLEQALGQAGKKLGQGLKLAGMADL